MGQTWTHIERGLRPTQDQIPELRREIQELELERTRRREAARQRRAERLANAEVEAVERPTHAPPSRGRKRKVSNRNRRRIGDRRVRGADEAGNPNVQQGNGGPPPAANHPPPAVGANNAAGHAGDEISIASMRSDAEAENEFDWEPDGGVGGTESNNGTPEPQGAEGADENNSLHGSDSLHGRSDAEEEQETPGSHVVLVDMEEYIRQVDSIGTIIYYREIEKGDNDDYLTGGDVTYVGLDPAGSGFHLYRRNDSSSEEGDSNWWKPDTDSEDEGAPMQQAAAGGTQDETASVGKNPVVALAGAIRVLPEWSREASGPPKGSGDAEALEVEQLNDTTLSDLAASVSREEMAPEDGSPEGRANSGSLVKGPETVAEEEDGKPAATKSKRKVYTPKFRAIVDSDDENAAGVSQEESIEEEALEIADIIDALVDSEVETAEDDEEDAVDPEDDENNPADKLPGKVVLEEDVAEEEIEISMSSLGTALKEVNYAKNWKPLTEEEKEEATNQDLEGRLLSFVEERLQHFARGATDADRLRGGGGKWSDSKITKAIEKLQMQETLIASRAPLYRMINDIALKQIESPLTATGRNVRWRKGTLEVIHTATEAFLTDLFRDAWLVTINAQRKTLRPNDLVTAALIRRDEDQDHAGAGIRLREEARIARQEAEQRARRDARRASKKAKRAAAREAARVARRAEEEKENQDSS